MPDNNKISSVLVVDDDSMILDMLKSFFTKEGNPCETAANAESALDRIRQTPFDVILTDINMTGMNGLELTKEAKKIRPDAIVILMTGFVEDFSYDIALEVGASDFIKKPFSLQEVLVRIKQAKMHKEIHEMSLKDELTGLYNRRGFFAFAEHMLKIEKRDSKKMFLLYADVDNLKMINDTWGHKEGDAALMEIAAILKAIYRESDVIARMGGDEFAVIPVRGDEGTADILISRLQDEIDAHNAKGLRSYTLSVSTGLACFEAENPCSIEDLLGEADKAMYENKKKKRIGLSQPQEGQ